MAESNRQNNTKDLTPELPLEPEATVKGEESSTILNRVDLNLAVFNTCLDNSSAFFEILQSDSSLAEKLSQAQDLAGEDSSLGKVLGAMSNLSKTQENIVSILSTVGEIGLPEDHISGIIATQNTPQL